MIQIDRYRSLALTGLLSLVAGSLGAQVFPSGLNPVGTNQSGFHLYDVTSFTAWQSNASPSQGFFSPFAANLGSDALYGVGTSVGWTRPGTRSNIAITYTGNYTGRWVYSDWNSFNQALSIHGSRRLSRRWTMGFSLASATNNYDQLLSSPTVFDNLISAPGSFDDLSAAVLAGKYNNDQLASILTGAPLIESPSRTLLFGNRIFSTSLGASATYAHSSRLSLDFSVTAARTQHLPDNAHTGSPQYPYLLNSAIYGSANAGVSYSVTPRTQLGVNLSTSRSFSRIGDYYVSRVTGTLGRTMGRHWFAELNAGGGFVNTVGSRSYAPRGAQPVAGATLGYKLYAQTFIASYERTFDVAYGAGAAQMTIESGAWQWQRPGRSWGLFASMGGEQMREAAFRNIQGWRASTGISRRLGTHTMFQTGYSYGSFSQHQGPTPFGATQHSVQVSMTWYPQSMER